MLLVHMASPDGWDGWITPGGALEEGETHEAAAARELIEEVGLADVVLGPPIWRRTRTFPFKGIEYEQHETFFYARLLEHVDHTPAFSVEQLADEGVLEHRWWSLEELEDMMTAPRGLVTLVRRLLSEGPPPEPFDAGD